MGLLGNAKINVRIHFGVIVLAALAGGAAIQIWGPPGALAEYREYAIWALGLLGVERVIAKNGGK